MEIKGSVVVVTGASSGIGLAVPIAAVIEAASTAQS
jgi:NAD(P)-dependent dehydrogenase (short-subunit alcohol dehydrogenase family)